MRARYVGVREQTVLEENDLTADVPRQIAPENVRAITGANHVHDVACVADAQRRRLADSNEAT